MILPLPVALVFVVVSVVGLATVGARLYVELLHPFVQQIVSDKRRESSLTPVFRSGAVRTGERGRA